MFERWCASCQPIKLGCGGLGGGTTKKEGMIREPCCVLK